MDFIYLIPSLLIAAILLFNIKGTADLLCQFASGFLCLIIYNSIAPVLTLPTVGVNAISALLCGMLGLPGGAMLICLNAFV